MDTSSVRAPQDSFSTCYLAHQARLIGAFQLGPQKDNVQFQKLFFPQFCPLKRATIYFSKNVFCRRYLKLILPRVLSTNVQNIRRFLERFEKSQRLFSFENATQGVCTSFCKFCLIYFISRRGARELFKNVIKKI